DRLGADDVLAGARRLHAELRVQTAPGEDVHHVYVVTREQFSRVGALVADAEAHGKRARLRRLDIADGGQARVRDRLNRLAVGRRDPPRSDDAEAVPSLAHSDPLPAAGFAAPTAQAV